ncbi:MAG: serine/threonine-protein kinase, partial [Myxococcota bacterium]
HRHHLVDVIGGHRRDIDVQLAHETSLPQPGVERLADVARGAMTAGERVSWTRVHDPVKRPVRAVFGKYTLIGKLAKGGMGEIYLARLGGVAGFEKIVVIKRILPHLAENKRYVAMLWDEARIAARLSHPNVCQVLELDEVDGEYYIAMEYLEGITMADLLRLMAQRKSLLDPRLAVAMITQVCEGLHAAHELVDRQGNPTNLVHRDISPSNLFITAAGPVKILDFGIAKTPDQLANTRTGTIKGKWAYMSPEQVLRKPLDRRSDIFSLGVVTYEALSSRRLFRRKSEYEICRAITERDAPPLRDLRPDIPEPLSQVVATALARRRHCRYDTASAMSKALTRSLTAIGGPASMSEVSEFVWQIFAKELEARRAFVRRADAAEAQGGGIALPVAPARHAESLESQDGDSHDSDSHDSVSIDFAETAT